MRSADCEIGLIGGKDGSQETSVDDGHAGPGIGGNNLEAIDELITKYADPLIKKILIHRLGLYYNPLSKDFSQSEAADLYQTVILKLMTGLNQENDGQDNSNIEEIHSYVAAITHNVCNDYLRRKYPARNRLKYQLRDLIRRQRELATWTRENRLICGLTKWEGADESVKALSLMREIEAESHPAGLQKIRGGAESPLSKLVSEILQWCEGPIDIENLVRVIALIQGVKDQPGESIDEGGLKVKRITGSAGADYEHLEAKELLTAIWAVLGELPRNQRKAFILTSRDYSGESLLHRMIRDRIVTLKQIYQSLGMTREELLAIWGRLPMDAPNAAMVMGTTARMIAKWRHRALRKLSETFKIGRKNK